MQKRRNTIQIWFYILTTTILIFFIGYSLKLSFINPQFHFYFKTCLYIISLISMNNSMLKNSKPTKVILNFFAIAFITLSILYHLFFEHFLYVTVIDLNGPKIAVQEHCVIEEYCIDFYRVRYIVFKQHLKSSICLDYPAFHMGDYRVVHFDNEEVVIEYINPNYDLPQKVTINY